MGITALGFALRTVRLEFQPLWWDEGWSLFFATRQFGTMLERTAVDIHPPLYYALLTIWMQFAGKGVIAVRLLSVVIGTMTIPLLYALAKRLFGTRVALVSAFLLAIAPFHVYYSQEVRMYGLVTFLCLASVYLFVVILDTSNHRRGSGVVWLLYVLASAAALYTQYYAAFVVAFQIFLVGFIAIRKTVTERMETAAKRGELIPGFPQGWAAGAALGRIVTAWLAVAALYMPWVLYVGPKLYTYVSMKVVADADRSLDPVTYAAQKLIAFSVGHVTAWTWLVPISSVSLVLLLLSLVYPGVPARHGKLRSRIIVILYLVVPLLFGYIVNLLYPFNPERGERLLLPAAPAFYMLVAAGILVLWERRKGIGLAALLFVVSICGASLYDFYSVPRYPNDDYRPLIANIQRLAQPGDLYLAVHPWQIGYLETYYDGAPLTIIETPSAEWMRDYNRLDRELGAMMAQHKRVWVPGLQTLGAVLENALDRYLRPRYYAVLDSWYGTTRLELFAGADEPRATNRTIPLKGALQIDALAVSSEPVAAGKDILPIRLNWKDSVPMKYSASFRLVDSRGNVWALDDRGIEKGEQRIGFAIPLGTPPGEYDLSLVVYRESNNPEDAVVLSKVAVTAPQTPNFAALPHRRSTPLADLLNLIGYDTVESEVEPGFAVGLTLYWQARRQLSEDYRVTVEAVDSGGTVYARSESAPARDIFPTSKWHPGDIVRDQHSLVLRGNAPDGVLDIAVSLIDASGRLVGTARVPRAVTVKGRPHYYAAPSPSTASDFRFGDIARLAGYDMDQERGQVNLILYWKALAPTNTSFKVFAHLVDQGENIINQSDQVPGSGAFPTTSWVKGEYLVDAYTLPLSSSLATGINVGMYDPSSGARLPVYDSSNQPLGDHIALPMRNN